MRMHISPTAAVVLAALANLPSAAAAQVRATVTADNAYMLGYGPATGPATWLAPVNNTTAAGIFSCNGGPEVYTLNPGVADYLYIAANSDKATTQGVIARLALTGGQVVVSGGAGWQVLATGNDVALSAGAANSALANTSLIWENSATATAPGLAVGELNVQNSTPNYFPVVCATGTNLIPANARWMWYQSRPGLNAFNANPPTGGHREFLIFRIPVRALMCACPRVRGDVTTETGSAIVPRGDLRVVPADSNAPRSRP
jgi:hypothetical protein